MIGLRVDAVANRAHIVAIARDAFAADPATSLNAIAKRAQVGPGTLYRHFPSRAALLVAVYSQEIDELVALAPNLLAEQPSIEAFRLWCRRFAVFGDVKHGVADMLTTALSEDQAQHTQTALTGAVRQLLLACAASGELRADVSPEDVLALLSTLLRVAPTVDGKAQRERLIALILAGFTGVSAG